jgi:Rieske Fe-S protein
MTVNTFNRRDFILKTLKASAIGIAAFNMLDITKIIARTLPPEDNKDYTEKTISLSDYPALQNVGGYDMITSKVILIRLTTSKFLAINIICTHKHCDVDFDGENFECPCHGSMYNKYGHVTHGPAVKNLKSYKTGYNSEKEEVTIYL